MFVRLLRKSVLVWVVRETRETAELAAFKVVVSSALYPLFLQFLQPLELTGAGFPTSALQTTPYFGNIERISSAYRW
jgi:hypothetical protein